MAQSRKEDQEKTRLPRKQHPFLEKGNAKKESRKKVRISKMIRKTRDSLLQRRGKQKSNKRNLLQRNGRVLGRNLTMKMRQSHAPKKVDIRRSRGHSRALMLKVLPKMPQTV
jgi:hypothetical protein